MREGKGTWRLKKGWELLLRYVLQEDVYY